jgi:hypothetical protein
MNILLSILIGFSSFQPLEKTDLKEFLKSFLLLQDAHHQNHDEIVGKYGPEVLDKYDLIQVSFKEGEETRVAYDSLRIWVDRYQEREAAVKALDSLQKGPTTQKALKLAEIEDQIQRTKDVQTKNALNEAALRAASNLLADPIDSLWRIRALLPYRLSHFIHLETFLTKKMDFEFQQAMNAGRPGLISYSLRFPGSREDEIQGQLQFIQIDDLNAALRSQQPADLIPIYKSLPEGPQKSSLRSKLETIMYARWQRCKILDDELKAAQDYLELFREEKKKSKSYQEVQDWYYYNTLPTPSPTTSNNPSTPPDPSTSIPPSVSQDGNIKHP